MLIQVKWQKINILNPRRTLGRTLKNRKKKENKAWLAGQLGDRQVAADQLRLEHGATPVKNVGVVVLVLYKSFAEQNLHAQS